MDTTSGKYGFTGISGQFYPLADDPMTAQIELDDRGIVAPLTYYREARQQGTEPCGLW